MGAKESKVEPGSQNEPNDSNVNDNSNNTSNDNPTNGTSNTENRPKKAKVDDSIDIVPRKIEMDPKKDPRIEETARFDKELVKVIVVGQSGVGKTALIRRMVHNSFLEKPTQTVRQAARHHPTDRVAVALRQMHCDNGDVVSLGFWDEATASPINVSDVFFEDVDAVVLMFDLTDTLSFDKLTVRLRRYVEKLGLVPIEKNPDDDEDAEVPQYPIPIIVVGNKLDDRPRINKRQLSKFVKENGCNSGFLVSARTDDGVYPILKQLRDYFIEHPKYSKEKIEAEYQAGIAQAREIVEKMAKESEERAARQKAAVSKPVTTEELEKKQPEKQLPTLIIGGKKIAGGGLRETLKRQETFRS